MVNTRNKRALGDIINGAGAKMREVRKRLGLSLKDFGAVVGSDKSYVCDWECGRKRLSFPKLIELCLHYGVTPNEILGFTEKEDEIVEPGPDNVLEWPEFPKDRSD